MHAAARAIVSKSLPSVSPAFAGTATKLALAVLASGPSLRQGDKPGIDRLAA
jgi:hypothetical protein